MTIHNNRRFIMAGVAILLAVIACAGGGSSSPPPSSGGSGGSSGGSSPSDPPAGPDVTDEDLTVEPMDDDQASAPGDNQPQESSPEPPVVVTDQPPVSTEEPVEEDTSLPEFVTDELFWTTGGGGPSARPDGCDEGHPNFWIGTWGGMSTFSDQHPYKNLDPEQGVYGLEYNFLQCNLPEGTEVSIAILPPQGDWMVHRTTVDSNGSLNTIWTSIPGEPNGQYTVQMSADDLHVGKELYFDIRRALYPVVNVVCDLLGGSDDLVLLTGFEPRERVAVIMYQGIAGSTNAVAHMGIHSYQYVEMDVQGMAFAQLPRVDGLVVAVGQDPKFVWDDPNGPGPMPADGYDAAECNR